MQEKKPSSVQEFEKHYPGVFKAFAAMGAACMKAAARWTKGPADSSNWESQSPHSMKAQSIP